MMTPVPAIVQQALRERRRGNHAQADLLLRAIVGSVSLTREWKQWALGQLLAVGQSASGGRSRNLSSYFNGVATTQPALARQVRALLPSSFITEGSFANAMAAYDANIRQYPNSNIERSALYGKFSYHLSNRQDTTAARSLLTQLTERYPQSVEAEMGILQMNTFRTSAASNKVSGGLSKSATLAATLATLPTEFALSQNYPNPFNPTTTIRFDLPENSNVLLVVYDVLGRKVAELANGNHPAGYHSAIWNASDVASGIYFARFTSIPQGGTSGNARFARIIKLVLMK
jgi:hypothetical protein